MDEAPTRVNFFDGMLLTGEDLQAEQEYCRRMRHLHNRLHGWGTVDGLQVTVGPDHTVQVDPGWAIDRQGREVVLTQPWSSEEVRERVADVVISWAEVPARPVPSRPDDGVIHTRWVEQPELALVARGEAPEDALLLARVKRGRLGRLSVDQSVRRPLSR